MELNEFINDATDKLFKEFHKAIEKLLMQDIIMIYNECYSSYDNYLDTIIKGNQRIDEIKSMGLSFCVHPKHIILDEEIFNFISSLRLLYKK